MNHNVNLPQVWNLQEVVLCQGTDGKGEGGRRGLLPPWGDCRDRALALSEKIWRTDINVCPYINSLLGYESSKATYLSNYSTAL